MKPSMFFFSIRHCPLFTNSMLLPAYTVPPFMLYYPSPPPHTHTHTTHPQPTLNPPSTPLSPFLSYSSFLLFFSLTSHFLLSPPCLAITEIAPHALCLLHPPQFLCHSFFSFPLFFFSFLHTLFFLAFPWPSFQPSALEISLHKVETTESVTWCKETM